MCRGWKGLALATAFGCLYGPAQAQVEGTYPSPVGAARMPEPIPCDPSTVPPPAPPPNLIPGPISPQAAPMGPPDDLSLPYNHTGAFQFENYVPEGGIYLHVGPMAYQRNHLGAGDIAVYNAPSNVPDPLVPTPAGTSGALNFNSVAPSLSLGLRGTVGYLWDNQAIELTSFYVFENDVFRAASDPGALNTLFYNPPLTFLGQGLFRDADKVSMTQGSSLFSSELNYRRWNPAFAGLDFIFGARYVRQTDILGITTEGTATIANSLGLPTPGPDMATYAVTCHNNIVAPQFGLEYDRPVWSWLTLSVMGKAAWGVNYLNTDVSLTRGDGLQAFNTLRAAAVFGQIYETGAFAYINLLQRLRIRLGYTATWLCGVAASVDQVNFNLMGAQARQAFGLTGVENAISSGNLQQINNAQQAIPHGNANNNGSMLYFGPQIELQFFF